MTGYQIEGPELVIAFCVIVIIGSFALALWNIVSVILWKIRDRDDRRRR